MVHRVPYSELLAANNLDSFWIVKLNIKEHEILHRVTRRPEVTDPRLNFQEHYPKTKINKMIFLPKNGSSLLSLFTFSSVQLLSCVRLFVTPWIAAHQAPCPSPTPRVHSNSRPSSRWCHPAISSSVVPFSSCPQIPPSMRWPKYWSFSFSIIPSKEHPGLISFRMDWLDLLAVQGTLKDIIQYY